VNDGPGICIWPPVRYLRVGRARPTCKRRPKGSLRCTGETGQLIFHTFLATIQTTRELRQTNRKIRSPSRGQRFYLLFWPAQAVSVQRGRIVGADVVWTPFAGVSAGPARADWRGQAGLEGRL
jgi:hypothetical protein